MLPILRSYACKLKWNLKAANIYKLILHIKYQWIVVFISLKE